MRWRFRARFGEKLVQGVVPAYLALCILLGGASAAGFLANMVLQLLALGLLYYALRSRRDTPLPRSARQLMLLFGLLLGLFALHLLPLPPALWTGLPGRGEVLAGYTMIDVAPPWLSLSLAPEKALASLLWLLPAFAVLLTIVFRGAVNLRWLAWTVAATTALSIALGAVQVAGGADAPAYLYQITNRGFAVGFFANANHHATLMVFAIPFLAAVLAHALDHRAGHRRAPAVVLVVGTALLLIAVGLVITNSLAGIGLAVPVAAASFLLVRSRQGRPPRWVVPLVAVLGLLAAAVVVSAPFDNDLTSENAKRRSLSRYGMYTTTLQAVPDYLPVGSGIGSFVDVYRQQEDATKVDRVYANHAHSDPIELLLETGLIGVALMLAFLFWWARRVAAIWTRAEPDAFARAATIASGAILAHSFFDYPLRTAAISALFAAALALMADPRERTNSRRRSDGGARHLTA